jgi:nucleoside-diphosphate-sugar epimerase
MHILVTGGFGFIGHHVVKRLKDSGHRITIIDDLRFINTELYMARGRHMDFAYDDWINADCSSTIVQDVDAIVHLACHPNQASFAKDGMTAWKNAIQSTLHMLTAYPNAKMIYISSSMVYGNWIGTVQESDPLRPVNAYGKAKLACERLVQDIANDWVIIRPTAVYGKRDDNNRVIAKWLKAAANHEPIHVDDTTAKLDFTYVEDVAQAICNAAVTPVSKVIANVSFGEGRTLLEAANVIKDWTWTKSEIVCGHDLSDDMPRRGAMEIRKAVQFLGYTPKTNLEDGIQKLIK